MCDTSLLPLKTSPTGWVDVCAGLQAMFLGLSVSQGLVSDTLHCLALHLGLTSLLTHFNFKTECGILILKSRPETGLWRQ